MFSWLSRMANGQKFEYHSRWSDKFRFWNQQVTLCPKYAVCTLCFTVRFLFMKCMRKWLSWPMKTVLWIYSNTANGNHWNKFYIYAMHVEILSYQRTSYQIFFESFRNSRTDYENLCKANVDEVIFSCRNLS
jgi:hypothetical protein